MPHKNIKVRKMEDALKVKYRKLSKLKKTKPHSAKVGSFFDTQGRPINIIKVHLFKRNRTY